MKKKILWQIKSFLVEKISSNLVKVNSNYEGNNLFIINEKIE